MPPRVGFEPTIPLFDQAKRVHALDRAATVIDAYLLLAAFSFDDHIGEKAVEGKMKNAYPKSWYLPTRLHDTVALKIKTIQWFLVH
jgi:hypothetical protein